MANRIVLISDDSDFFDFMKTKLELRNSDELFSYSFDEIPDKLQFLQTAVLIVNGESSEQKAIDLLKIFNNTPVIVAKYNDDEAFKKKCYRAGMFDFITLSITDAEFRARMIPALNYASILEKNRQYRDILVRNKIVTKNNEVFTDYCNILDNELLNIQNNSGKAVFAAISPNDKSKFLMHANYIETVILNNIRKNDILMSYAPNKYFLLMFDADIKTYKKLWEKIVEQFPYKLYAGFVQVKSQGRQQLVNDALNKLHEAINNDKDFVDSITKQNSKMEVLQRNSSPYSNFKLYKQEFGKRFNQIVTPVFYQVQQKYLHKISGVNIEQNTGDDFGSFLIRGKIYTSSFKITTPGFSKINIDITKQKSKDEIDTKRITLDPEEFEPSLLEDLLEQFVAEANS